MQRYMFRYSCVNLNELAFALSSVKARGKAEFLRDEGLNLNGGGAGGRNSGNSESEGGGA